MYSIAKSRFSDAQIFWFGVVVLFVGVAIYALTPNGSYSFVMGLCVGLGGATTTVAGINLLMARRRTGTDPQ
ncbi:MAG: hypothetical protein GIW95_06240 [Candidatus Eremiobacteraeota bacterium]|nr:hypothetical protein [Candidatus Eremiobacteraeota bacterium]